MLEEDIESERVKVRYVGYGSEHDEWRAKGTLFWMILTLVAVKNLKIFHLKLSAASNKFCLYDELAYCVKCCLMLDRKSDPVHHICMPFDTVYFNGLVK